MHLCIVIIFLAGHGFEGSTVYVGIDTHTGQLVAISEWVMKWCHIASRGNVDKKMETDPKTAATCLKQVRFLDNVHNYIS